jgi:hypothetical protein
VRCNGVALTGGRAVAVITGLTLLLIVDVRGVAFYIAWSLIVLALASEAAATLVLLAPLTWRVRTAQPGMPGGAPQLREVIQHADDQGRPAEHDRALA